VSDNCQSVTVITVMELVLLFPRKDGEETTTPANEAAAELPMTRADEDVIALRGHFSASMSANGRMGVWERPPSPLAARPARRGQIHHTGPKPTGPNKPAVMFTGSVTVI